MIVHDVAQRSPEWAALRAGRFCASRASDMLATRADGKPAAGRTNLRVQLVLENVTKRSLDSDFQSAAMLQGIEREADALAAYEAQGAVVRSVGFVSHDTLMAGGSPDGVIGNFVGLVEAKCCIPATHLDFLKTGTVPGEYGKQILHLLWLTGAQWCDYLSYQPDFPEPLRVKVVRVLRDEGAIGQYDTKVRTFLAEVNREVEAVNTLANLGSQLKAAVA